LRTLHLCCGRGGSLWTGEILGWNHAAALDTDPWRCACLRAEAEAGWWGPLQVLERDIADPSWHAEINGHVDCIAAGFSCRDISAAGSGHGLSGKTTGPTYAGCINAIRFFKPAWVFFENSPRIRTRGRDRITADLVASGYRWRDGKIAASAVGAPHRRDRWFLLAKRFDIQATRSFTRTSQPAPVPSHALRDGLQVAVQRGGLSKPGSQAIEAAARYCSTPAWNPAHARLLRMVDGLADRGHRIRALGDAWVPLQAATAWRALGGPS
jgi:DNA (cytosine-5)-methyltransferase 1